MLRKLFGMAPADESTTVDVAEAKRKLAAREALMIDVRLATPGTMSSRHTLMT